VEKELIYIEKTNYDKKQEKGNNGEKNSKDVKNINKPNNNNLKDRNIIEKELKQKEKEKKKEKFRNIEIKTTTRQTTYANSNNNKILEVVGNGIGMTSITDHLNTVIKGLGKNESEDDQFVKTPAKEVIGGLKAFKEAA
jgi:hypothetical protein